MKARSIMLSDINNENRQIPFELFNNIIVLFYELGDINVPKN